MRHDYGSTVCIIALLLTALFCITFSGCGDDDGISVNDDVSDDVSNDVLIASLVASPEQYRGDVVKVYGDIVTSGVEKESFLVLLKDGKDNLICEFFAIDTEQRSQLENKKSVIISGKFDILAGITFLRECEIKED